MPKILIFIIPLLVSLSSLWIVIHDRRPKLILRAKKGTWAKIIKATNGTIFEARIEVYNASSRSNAIRDYRFYWKPSKLVEEVFLESEQWEISWGPNTPRELRNVTPLTLAPYSGSEVELQALAKGSQQPIEMKVRVEIEDLFGKTSSIELIAEHK